MPPVSGTSSGRSAFTLVELLVVISIVAVLAALLLPVLSSVKKRSALTKCLGNHHQITSAYLLYISENNNTLWYRPADGTWSGGSGGIFGPQNYASAPGNFCYLLKSYGLGLAKWDSWKPIPDREKTVWYCPATYQMADFAGSGATYFYQNLGTFIGNTTSAVRLNTVGEYVARQWYLRDYYGSHDDDKQLYSLIAGKTLKTVYSYLDGHSEYR